MNPPLDRARREPGDPFFPNAPRVPGHLAAPPRHFPDMAMELTRAVASLNELRYRVTVIRRALLAVTVIVAVEALLVVSLAASHAMLLRHAFDP